MLREAARAFDAGLAAALNLRGENHDEVVAGFRVNLAEVARAAEGPAAEHRALRRAQLLQPRSARIAAALGAAYARAGRKRDAKRFYEAALLGPLAGAERAEAERAVAALETP